MQEALVAIGVIGGFFALRAIAATWVFFYLLPDGDRCLNCDAVTLRVESRGWNTLLPWFRTSWCLDCGWHGLLRNGPTAPTIAPRESLARHH